MFDFVAVRVTTSGRLKPSNRRCIPNEFTDEIQTNPQQDTSYLNNLIPSLLDHFLVDWARKTTIHHHTKGVDELCMFYRSFLAFD